MAHLGRFECISPGPKIKKGGGAKIAPPKLGAKAPKVKFEFWDKSPAKHNRPCRLDADSLKGHSVSIFRVGQS